LQCSAAVVAVEVAGVEVCEDHAAHAGEEGDKGVD
jgi:hypothetical protein